ncbi:conserved hypothetical protein [Pediculus humanus corporis]|uniref:Uncharacterized protein n=1 Tax=Pediculus humanus subsp. corporis TaxID=121224 RepID=E0VG87_PEDHC|nr:uncharacterized protein Phum_PHUM176290 [Pediculus humanus corporis]EEB12393.1 conserved hypothetical protein [Pediculus humanus corporis]
MNNSIGDLIQFDDCTDLKVASIVNKTSYISCIKIHGKPILPPLISEEKRLELRKYKEKAIEIEKKLQKNKVNDQISSDVSPISTLPPSRQSTPARPASLDLNEKCPGQTYLLSKSKTEGSLHEYSKTLIADSPNNSSQPSFKKLDFNSYKSTLEQRLALEENLPVKQIRNKYKQSPIVEEKWCDSEEDFNKWSPLKVEPLNSFKVTLQNENLEKSLDDSQNTPDTITQSPSLLRQNSYTLLTPSPALLGYLESEKKKKHENVHRSNSGRKTWNLSKAQEKWNPNNKNADGKTINGQNSSDEQDVQTDSKKGWSSFEDFSTFESSNQDVESNDVTEEKAFTNGSGTSPESYKCRKGIPVPIKLKCKIKGKKSKLFKSVPSPKSSEKVQTKSQASISKQNPPDYVPSEFKNELSELSNLLVQMKFNHEKQKKDLEERQQTEMKQLEILFKKKEEELLKKIQLNPKKSRKSVYSHKSKNPETNEYDIRVMGDGNHSQGKYDRENFIEEKFVSYYKQCRRPHSAKDFHHIYSYEDIIDENKRARSTDFNHGNQDTDLDVSFPEEFVQQSRDATLNNDCMTESDSISNFSSRSSTMSSENKPDLIPVVAFKKYRDLTKEEYDKYVRAATKITAAVRGYLTRRLLRTAHVQGLITTLKDAIICATQLHSASDIADSDIDLMRRLGRQIEAAWDAVYGVFFNTETTTRLQLIAADRERLKAIVTKNPIVNDKKKRISSATRKSLDRKRGNLNYMSKSQSSNGCTRVRMCTKMANSYPSPYFPQKLK